MTATGIEYSFPLSSLQEGMLFHALYAPAPACTSNSSWVSSMKSGLLRVPTSLAVGR